MITGIDWYEYQISEKKKQLKKHQDLAEQFKGKDEESIYRQLAYDDKHYLIMLKHDLENFMWYRDDRLM